MQAEIAAATGDSAAWSTMGDSAAWSTMVPNDSAEWVPDWVTASETP